jgi:hypothetical protein
MTLDEIREALQDRRLSIVGRRTGLHPSTIAKVRDKVGQPTYDTVKRLAAYFAERGQ